VNVAGYGSQLPHLVPQAMGVLATVVKDMLASIVPVDDVDDNTEILVAAAVLKDTPVHAGTTLRAESAMVVVLDAASVLLFRASSEPVAALAVRCVRQCRAFEAVIKSAISIGHCGEVEIPVDNYSAAELIRRRLQNHKRPLIPPLHPPPPSSSSAKLAASFISIPPPSPFDVKVTFLGTGCATPSKHRNGSCVMLQGRVGASSHAMLLDAGEGSVSQLFQACGGEESRVWDHLASLDLLWLSHHHADHICGVPMLLEILRVAVALKHRQLGRKLFIVTSKDLWAHIDYVASINGLNDLVVFVDIMNTLASSCIAPELSMLYKAMPLVSLLISVPVYHCRQSFGLVLNLLHDSIRVVYSGDCRPSEQLMAAGKNCHLLIHEATFDDSLQGDAVAKKHCTVSESLDVGARMRARHVVLTHFSQRYPQLPTYSSTLADSVSFVSAFDLLGFYYPSQIDAVCKVTAALMRASMIDVTNSVDPSND
jgi:ribonuclease BN (tRNA processing enzyme)